MANVLKKLSKYHGVYIFSSFHLFTFSPLSCLQFVTFLTFGNTSRFLFSLQITSPI
ncbi:hypothetical protein HMPREF9151_02075 [Hoylesella saccharolytica F0055]|uniref:Uncharacterized protein n=1 Tax=Hoylesella saccharolytica F0055 TaxID=1127699 RepID=L1N2Z7_9BACT|nr:hypothetical protein HMPREF9151_02075 [Hoylesella saccharolytica F0055]